MKGTDDAIWVAICMHWFVFLFGSLDTL